MNHGSLGAKNLHDCPRFFTERHVDVCLREELRDVYMRGRERAERRAKEL